MATTEQIQAVRYEVQDTDPALPFLNDDTLSYFIDKHEGNIPRASLDAARAILLQLSMRSNETVDIFSLSNSKTATAYRDALLLFITNPTLNPILSGTSTSLTFGGTSKSAVAANSDNSDNITVQSPSDSFPVYRTSYFDFLK
jgi:hypothetical protein